MKTLLCLPMVIAALLSAAALRAAEPAATPKDKPSDEKQAQQDLKQIQGIWVRTERSGLFSSRRITKNIQGDRETVTYYNSDGSVEHAHAVTFAVRRAGPVRIFSFSDQEMTAGPDQGKKTDARGEYVYKVVGETFVEIWGVLGDEDRDPEVLRWQRAKAEK